MSSWAAEYESEKTGNTTFSTKSRSKPPFGSSATRYDNDGDITMSGPTVGGPSSSGATRVEDEEQIEETPLEQLTRHWMNERHAPDLLPRQEVLLASLLDHIHRQTNIINTLRSDPRSSEDEHLRIMLVQTEIERVKFMVNSYTRTRLFKIEKYARFIVTDEFMQTRLTAGELNHATRFAAMTDRHFRMSVLQSLPEPQSHLDDEPIFMPSMITQPDKTKPVFVRARRHCPPIRLKDGTALEMSKGHISLLPFDVVEDLILRGDVELV